MKYNIIEDNSISKLVISVNNAIKDGWAPIGSICTDPYFIDRHYYQAMVKND